MMEGVWVLVVVAVVGYNVLRRVNPWIYEGRLGEKKYSLPPGDLGWPFIGNMWSFLRAFKSPEPDSFISSFFTRSVHVCILIIHFNCWNK
ncbi:Ent-kaurenoic acid oxidase 2 [Dionaea muscipula]